MDVTFHQPVLCEQIAQYLLTNSEGTYVDCTVGGGGHAEFLVKKLGRQALYLGLDKDVQALAYAKKRLARFPNIQFHHSNFAVFETVLDKLQISQIDGLLLDLGVSSHQIDDASRGFSYLQDTALDMRMDQNDTITAAQLVNSYSRDHLSRIFFEFGEERKARQIARLIESARLEEPIQTTRQLRAIIDQAVPSRFALKSYARIFQALRIEINQELENLKQVLEKGLKRLTKGGRIVIISYHSLEDRIVKTFLRSKSFPCICPPEFPQCVCGKKAEVKILTKRVVRPLEDEVKNNARARSARLRSGEKV